MSMRSLITLPAIDTYGQLYVADGDALCGFQSNRKPFGPCIKMEPTTGPLFDLAIVDNKYLYLLYKCGFMVAYFVSGNTVLISAAVFCISFPAIIIEDIRLQIFLPL